MTAFLSTLGGKLAERWLALVVLPGLLYLTAVTVAVTLGQRHWSNTAVLRDELNTVAAEPALRGTGTVVLVLLAVLAGSAAAGLVAQALGIGLERLWLTDSSVLSALTNRRVQRWTTADQDFRVALVAAGKAEIAKAPEAKGLTAWAGELNAARNRISLAAPTHPFWLGDRVGAVDTRTFETYQLDLVSAWPRLWLVVPDAARAELGTARTALSAAARLGAWGVGYVVVGIWWWPAIVVGAVVAVTAWWRGRVAGQALADLLESTVDLYGRQLADALGVDCPGPLTPEIGAEITRTLRKRT
ncbi:MAG TPA: hypothetical protein VFX16_30815 [Pseudonocardiaceae bacterium]|nr:hypothetical protein [Pseudonocardiaceae bacterium]